MKRRAPTAFLPVVLKLGHFGGNHVDEAIFALAAALGTATLLEILLWYPWLNELLIPPADQ